MGRWMSKSNKVFNDWNEVKITIKDLEQKLYDSEADWIKMRDIADETQRKLDEGDNEIANYRYTIKKLIEGNEFKCNQLAESQATLREAIEVISKIAHDRTPPWDKLDAQCLCLNFLAKIEGK